MDTRSDELLQAALATGTIDKVAYALHVEPALLYRWIGGLQAADREGAKVVARLRLLRAFEAYFDRRNQRIGAAWQQ